MSRKILGRSHLTLDLHILNSTTEEELKFPPPISNTELILQLQFKLLHIVIFLSFMWI